MNTDDYTFYKNTGYRNTRNRKQILILDVNDSAGEAHLGSGEEFSVDLFEPLIIDKQSEVYLDNFISINSNITNDSDNSAFVLKINEFNINSNVASTRDKNTIFNSIIIPNEHNNLGDNHSMIVHKAKKFNYICDINPGKIGRISGTITNLTGRPIFHGTHIDHKHTYALIGVDTISTGTLAFPIPNSARVVLTCDNIDPSAPLLTIPPEGINAIFLGIHLGGVKTIYFSTVDPLGNLNRVNPGIITFTPSPDAPLHETISSTLSINNTNLANNPNLHLISGPGRFIAEFSINSRE